jgi:hypothetical protein
MSESECPQAITAVPLGVRGLGYGTMANTTMALVPISSLFMHLYWFMASSSKYQRTNKIIISYLPPPLLAVF